MRHQVDEYREAYEQIRNESWKPMIFEAIRKADPETAWEIFSDYDSLPNSIEFVRLLMKESEEALDKIDRIMTLVLANLSKKQ